MTEAKSSAPDGPAGNQPGRTVLSPLQRRQLSRGVQYVIFAGIVVLLALNADWATLREHFADVDVAGTMFPDLITVAAKNTVIYTVTAYLVAFVVGLVVALMRLSSAAPYRWVALIYIEIFRGLPILVFILFFAFVMPVAFEVQFPYPPYGIVAVALGLPASAYLAEIFRAGIEAVPRGQLEAARSLGMPYLRAMVSIILPQAIRIVIPPMTNMLVILFKDSSLVFAIGVTASTTELTKFARDIANTTGDSTPYIVGGLMYLSLTVPLGYLARRLEARQRRGR